MLLESLRWCLHWLIPVEYLLSKEFTKVLIVRSQHCFVLGTCYLLNLSEPEFDGVSPLLYGLGEFIPDRIGKIDDPAHLNHDRLSAF